MRKPFFTDKNTGFTQHQFQRKAFDTDDSKEKLFYDLFCDNKKFFIKIGAGFTLMEVVIALFLTVVIAGIFSVSLSTLRLNRANKFLLEAQKIGMEEMEIITETPFEILPATSTCTTSSPCSFFGVHYNFPSSATSVWSIQDDTVSGGLGKSYNFNSSLASRLDNNINGLAFLSGTTSMYSGDFTVEGKIRIDAASAASTSAGFVFHYKDQKNYYRVYYKNLSASTLILEKIVDGTLTSLATNSLASFANNAAHTLQIITNGSSIKIYLDDLVTPKINTTDNSLTEGGIGLLSINTAASGQTGIYFDNVKIINVVNCPTTPITNCDKTWNFESTVNSQPNDLIRFGLYDLPSGQGELIIEDSGGVDLKKITVKVKWLDSVEKTLTLYHLLSKYGINFK